MDRIMSPWFEGYITAGINIEICVFGICVALWQASAYARVQYWYLDSDAGQTAQLPETSGHYMTVNVHLVRRCRLNTSG